MFFNRFLTEGKSAEEAREICLDYLRGLYKTEKANRAGIVAIAEKVKNSDGGFYNFGFRTLIDEAEKLCFPVEYQEREDEELAAMEAAEYASEQAAENAWLRKAEMGYMGYDYEPIC